MKRTSLQFRPPLQFLAAATTDVSGTTMSSRPPYRGGFRRGFSDRPNTAGRGQRGQFVTGDSHYRSVRDANLGYRRGDSGGLPDQSGGFLPQQHQHPRPSPYAQNAQFRQTPPYNRNNHDNSNNNNSRQWNRPYRPFDPNAGPRPPQQFRPKPLDYRNWEYATLVKPQESERFVVLSYNILADYLANNHRSKLYYHIPRHMMDWEWRKKNILFELRLWSADIMCFQEVDRFQELEEELKHRGYSGIWKMRTGTPIDGCAIFWRMSRFKLLHEECIEFIKLGLRDNVAQICVLELTNQNCTDETGAHPQSSSGSCKVVICNIHVLYNPRRGEIKLGQVRVLLNKAHSVSKLWDDAPVIVCGDFNCTPKSPLYNFISERKLDISSLDRDKVSGQATAEIPAGRRYNPSSETGSVKSSTLDPLSVDGKEVNLKLSDSVSDIEKTNPDSNMENVPAMDNSLPQYVDTGLDVSDESRIDMQSREDDSRLRKETQQDAVDGCVSTLSLPVDGSRELSSTSFSEDELTAARTNNGIYPEEVYTDVIHTESSEKVDVPAHLNPVSLVGHVEFNDYVESENLNRSESKNSFQRNRDLAVARTDLEHADDLKSEISSSEPSCQTSCSNAFEVFPPRNSGNISARQKLCDDVGEKLENLSLNELDKSVAEDGDVGEDDSKFLSALHNSGDAFPSDFGQLRSDLAVSDNSKEPECIPHSSPLNLLGDEVEDDLSPSLDPETVDMEKTAYDPSFWTPMEIETASGNAEFKLLEHPLMLSSTYTDVKDCSGTRDSNGEPLVTSYNRCFFGTVDYIWRSEGLQTVRVLAPMQKQAMQWTPGFPTKKWGSDHIALAAELALVKDVRNHHTEVQEQ